MPPLTNKLHLFAKPLLRGDDFRLCLIGDSKTTDGSTNSNLGFGINRTWSPPAWVGRAGHVYGGPPAWAASVYAIGSAGALANPAPGDVFPGSGISGVNPNICHEKRFTSDLSSGPDGDWYFQLNDLAQYAVGDWTSGRTCKARAVWYATSTGVVGGTFIGRRERSEGEGQFQAAANTVTVDFTTNNALAAPGPMQYTDVNCGILAGSPNITWRNPQTAYDETNKNYNILGARIYLTDGSGNPLTGFSLMDVAQGAKTSVDIYSNIGGGVSPLTSSVNAIKWFDLMGAPNYWIIELGQNLTGAEAAELSAGTYSTYKTNIANIIDRINTICANYTVPVLNPVILLISPYQTAYTSTTSSSRSQALYELSQERSNVCFIDGYALLGTPSQSIFNVSLAANSIATNVMPPTGGTFTLTYKGQTTSALPYNSTKASLISAISGLSSVGIGNVSIKCNQVSGGSSAVFPFQIVMQGTLATDTTSWTVSGASLTGGSNYTLIVNPYIWWLDPSEVHPDAKGACYWASKIWGCIVNSYYGASSGSPLKGIIS